jgi:hypothetical protein
MKHEILDLWFDSKAYNCDNIIAIYDHDECMLSDSNSKNVALK